MHNNKSAIKLLKFISSICGVFLFFLSVMPVYAQDNTYSKADPIVITRTNESNAKSVDIVLKKSDTKGAVLGTTSLTFTVVPDLNGNWTYSIPDGLDPGTYNVIVKDSNGKVLETSTVVVTSTTITKVLPETGLLEDLMMPIIISFVLITVGFFLYIRSLKYKIAK